MLKDGIIRRPYVKMSRTDVVGIYAAKNELIRLKWELHASARKADLSTMLACRRKIKELRDMIKSKYDVIL